MVVVTERSVIVRLDKRAYSPHLVASGLAEKLTPKPWFGNKKLVIESS
jgi:hypothetical protein